MLVCILVCLWIIVCICASLHTCMFADLRMCRCVADKIYETFFGKNSKLEIQELFPQTVRLEVTIASRLFWHKFNTGTFLFSRKAFPND